MPFYAQKRKGFAINYELAEELEIINELLWWEEEYNQLPLLEAIEEKFGVEAERVCTFESSRGDDVPGLQGFEYDATYILFDEYTEKISPDEWENLGQTLEENDTDIIEGSWAEAI